MKNIANLIEIPQNHRIFIFVLPCLTNSSAVNLCYCFTYPIVSPKAYFHHAILWRYRRNTHATYPGDSRSQTSWKFIQSRCGFIRKLHFRKQIYEGNIWNQHRHLCDVSVRRTVKYRSQTLALHLLSAGRSHNFIGMTHLSDQYCKNMLSTYITSVHKF